MSRMHNYSINHIISDISTSDDPYTLKNKKKTYFKNVYT